MDNTDRLTLIYKINTKINYKICRFSYNFVFIVKKGLIISYYNN